jgi:hypothetical protein
MLGRGHWHAQGREVVGRVRVAALHGALEGGLRGADSALLGEQHSQVSRCGCVSEPIRAAVRALRAAPVVALLQEHAQVEGAVDVIALQGASIRGLGTRDVPALFQQDAEVAGGRGVASRVGAPVRRLGFGKISPPLQLHSHAELTLGLRAAVVHGLICAESNPTDALQEFF